MNNAEFLRKQLIVLALCVPTLYALIFFPFALITGMWIIFRPLYAISIALAASVYIVVGVAAWKRGTFIRTALFVLLSSAPLVGQFVVLPEMEKRHFRSYRHIPDDAKIVYYRESGIRDVTRFCIVQHPKAVPPRSNVTHYRPFLPGALAIMRNVQNDLGIPDSKMPDPNKRSVFYSGGSNETAPDGWMYLDVYDAETSREWIFEYGY